MINNITSISKRGKIPFPSLLHEFPYNTFVALRVQKQNA